MVNKPVLFRGTPFGRSLPLASACCKWDVQEESDSPCRHDFRSWATQDIVKLGQIAYHIIPWMTWWYCNGVCVCLWWFPLLLVKKNILFKGPLWKYPSDIFGCLSAVSLTVVCSKGLSIQMLAAATLANITSTVRRLFGARHCRIVPTTQKTSSLDAALV